MKRSLKKILIWILALTLTLGSVAVLSACSVDELFGTLDESSASAERTETTAVPMRRDISQYDGFVQIHGVWYCYDHGTVIEDRLVRDPTGEVNGSGVDTWWYVRDSCVDTSYTGFAENENGWWYVSDGSITYQENGLFEGTVDGKTGWWYVAGNLVQLDYSGILDSGNEGVDRVYVRNGMADLSYTGFAEGDDGWWYVSDGRVSYETTGMMDGAVNAAEGLWYVNGGKVESSCSGLVDFGENTWFVVNGQVQTGYSGPLTYNGVLYQVGEGRLVAENPDNGTGGEPDDGTGGEPDDGTGGEPDDGTGGEPDNGTGGEPDDGTVGEPDSGTTGEPEADVDEMTQKAQTYFSSTDYMIMVDTTRNRTGIFTGSIGNWTKIYDWICTTGSASDPTLHGEFTVINKGLYFNADEEKDEEYTCWYWTRFVENYMFHSVIYEQDSDENIIDGRLGMNLSHGCVRLETENAKWIYTYIPYNTRVVVY